LAAHPPGPAIYRFPGCPGQSSYKPKHTQAQTDITHAATDNGIQRRQKTLCKNNDSPMGEAVRQGDLQDCNGPE